MRNRARRIHTRADACPIARETGVLDILVEVQPFMRAVKTVEIHLLELVNQLTTGAGGEVMPILVRCSENGL